MRRGRTADGGDADCSLQIAICMVHADVEQNKKSTIRSGLIQQQTNKFQKARRRGARLKGMDKGTDLGLMMVREKSLPKTPSSSPSPPPISRSRVSEAPPSPPCSGLELSWEQVRCRFNFQLVFSTCFPQGIITAWLSRGLFAVF